MGRVIRIGLAFSYSYTYYRGVLRGIRSFAETRPDWVFTPIFPDEHSLNKMGAIKPDAVIACINTKPLVRALRSWNRPLVNVSAVLPGLTWPRVGVDSDAIGRLAAQHFLERGLLNFAFVGHPNWLYSVERELGFRRVVKEAGHELTSYHVDKDESFDPTGGHWPLLLHVQRWLRALPKPVGLFTPSDVWGMQMTEACRQTGLRIPEDVALVGVDNDDLHGALARPSLSSVQVPTLRIGQAAAALLEQLLNGKSPPVQPLLFPPESILSRRSSEVLAIDDPDVVQAVRFIREHGHMPLTVDDVLREVPVGRRSLERRFRRTLNRGLWEEIRRVHVEQAKRLLTETDLPVKAIAMQSGFTDFRHLAVVFRQEVGLSPTAYRSRIREST